VIRSIRAEALSKNFDGVAALQHVSFELAGPGCVGIVGPNGSGKSTLLGLLSGVLPPTSGEIFVNGERLTGEGPAGFRRAGVARCFQYPRVVPTLLVWENIAIGTGFRPGARDSRRAVEQVAARVGLEQLLDRWPDQLPLSLHRRIELARALIGEPGILLLDEPAAGLTEHETDAFVEVIDAAAGESLTVVVEHNLHVVDAAASRVLVLLEGVLLEDGPTRAVRASDAVKEAYFGVV
jgi:branched-chain amino acid transport system ATP-binding protein